MYDEKINMQFINLEKAQFILQKSEEFLSELKGDYKYIDNKTASLRTFLVVSIAATLNYYLF
jgi:hypothetical protein